MADDEQADHNQLWGEIEPVMQEVQRLVLTAPADDRQRFYLALSVTSHALGTAGALLPRLDSSYQNMPQHRLYDDALKVMHTMTDKLREREIN